jgi:hypothetical protein
MTTRYQYPDISDIIAQKARGRRERALLSFAEKLDILDKLREELEPIVRARQARPNHLPKLRKVTPSPPD